MGWTGSAERSRTHESTIERPIVRELSTVTGKDATSGVFYIATGQKHIAEACASARSCADQMKGLARAALCDDPSLLQDRCFDVVERLDTPTYSFLDKVVGVRRSPFDKTLYMDSDTLFIEPCCELFALLDRFDLAAAHAPWRWIQRVANCPECFPEVNTGVILYKNVPQVHRFLARWESIYQAQYDVAEEAPPDQPAFRQALYESDLRFTVLTPEYNLRTLFPSFAGGNSKVKILHGRTPSLDRLRPAVNQRRTPRVFPVPRARKMMVAPEAVFVRIPKTASSSIESVLSGQPTVMLNSRLHCLPKDDWPDGWMQTGLSNLWIETLGPEKWNQLFSFAFVRNPYDRAISSWRHVAGMAGRGSPINHDGTGKPVDPPTALSFGDFLDLCQNDLLLGVAKWHATAQHVHVTNMNGGVNVDFVGRVETLVRDFDHVCERIGIAPMQLPHKNRTESRREYRHYYNGQRKKLIAKLYERDIDVFGYSFKQGR